MDNFSDDRNRIIFLGYIPDSAFERLPFVQKDDYQQYLSAPRLLAFTSHRIASLSSSVVIDRRTERFEIFQAST